MKRKWSFVFSVWTWAGQLVLFGVHKVIKPKTKLNLGEYLSWAWENSWEFGMGGPAVQYWEAQIFFQPTLMEFFFCRAQLPPLPKPLRGSAPAYRTNVSPHNRVLNNMLYTMNGIMIVYVINVRICYVEFDQLISFFVCRDNWIVWL